MENKLKPVDKYFYFTIFKNEDLIEFENKKFRLIQLMEDEYGNGFFSTDKGIYISITKLWETGKLIK